MSYKTSLKLTFLALMLLYLYKRINGAIKLKTYLPVNEMECCC